MTQPNQEKTSRKHTRGETLFLCALCIIPGIVLVLLAFGIVSGNVTTGPAGRLLSLAAGLVFIFGGVMIFLRDSAGVKNNEEIPANAPRWIRLGEGFFGIAVIAAFALISSVIAFGPFFSSDMLPDLTRQLGGFGATLFRLISGAFALIFWYAVIYIIHDKTRKRGT